ncbi:ferritin-like domain-containing protein [Hymenobacter sp. CA1UV-4]|nr:ferritin-like domain-containing protein [Hymenobacter sp. CA1UV-4]
MPENPAEIPASDQSRPLARRRFLRYSGAGLAAGGLWLAGCAKDKDEITPSSRLDVGSGDTGILNFAYALEQLEAAFYAQVVAGPYFAGASAAEKDVLRDLRDHEAIHAAFFKNLLGSNAIRDLTPDFSNIDFAQRTTAQSASRLGVLNAARAFEDLGVAAYNGVGRYIVRNDYLLLAGKIVSVEARHAAIIRELITANTFVASDVVDTTNNGLEKSKRPQDVLTIANTFLAEGSKLSALNFK